MLKLPLFLEVRPRIIQSSTIPLERGKWKIEAKGLIDTKINLSLGNSVIMPIYHDKEIDILHDCYIQASIIQPGNEKSISIYIIKQDGTLPTES